MPKTQYWNGIELVSVWRAHVRYSKLLIVHTACTMWCIRIRDKLSNTCAALCSALPTWLVCAARLCCVESLFVYINFFFFFFSIYFRSLQKPLICTISVCVYRAAFKSFNLLFISENGNDAMALKSFRRVSFFLLLLLLSLAHTHTHGHNVFSYTIQSFRSIHSFSFYFACSKLLFIVHYIFVRRSSSVTKNRLFFDISRLRHSSTISHWHDYTDECKHIAQCANVAYVKPRSSYS